MLFPKLDLDLMLLLLPLVIGITVMKHHIQMTVFFV
jgi:hypothetical protein